MGIEIKVGAFSFTGEVTERWLSIELEKLLTKIPELVEVSRIDDASGDDSNQAGASKKKNGKVDTLAAFLKDKSATASQAKKFQAAAVWLHEATGSERLTIGEVLAHF